MTIKEAKEIVRKFDSKLILEKEMKKTVTKKEEAEKKEKRQARNKRKAGRKLPYITELLPKVRKNPKKKDWTDKKVCKMHYIAKEQNHRNRIKKLEKLLQQRNINWSIEKGYQDKLTYEYYLDKTLIQQFISEKEDI